MLIHWQTIFDIVFFTAFARTTQKYVYVQRFYIIEVPGALKKAPLCICALTSCLCKGVGGGGWSEESWLFSL